MAKIRSITGFFGQKIHYDEKGNRVGESWPGLFEGSMEHYDASGEHVGSSMPGLINDYVHYDDDNNAVGYSQRGLFGTTHHYGEDGYEGDTVEGLFSSTTDIDFDF